MSHSVAAESFTYDDRNKRDPFWELVSTGGAIANYETEFLVTDLNLEGIILGTGEDNIAIINGRVVKSKDQLGNFVVVDIKKDVVVLVNKDQQKFELKLKKEE